MSPVKIIHIIRESIRFNDPKADDFTLIAFRIFTLHTIAYKLLFIYFSQKKKWTKLSKPYRDRSSAQTK